MVRVIVVSNEDEIVSDEGVHRLHCVRIYIQGCEDNRLHLSFVIKVHFCNIDVVLDEANAGLRVDRFAHGVNYDILENDGVGLISKNEVSSHLYFVSIRAI